MMRVTSEVELLNVWSDVVLTSDPLAALASMGIEVSPALREQVTRPGTKTLTKAQRTSEIDRYLLTKRPPGVGATTFGLRTTAAPLAASLPEGEFDVVASLRLEVVDHLLVGLYQAHAWPRTDPAGDVPVTIADLRDLSDDIPQVAGIEVGQLHLEGPPTADVGAANTLRISQTARLDIDVVQQAVPRRVTVTSLIVTVTYDALPQAVEGESGQVTIVLDATRVTEDFLAGVTITVDSPIQARDPAALETFLHRARAALSASIHAFLFEHPLVLTPNIHMPFDPTVPVRVLAGRVGTSPADLGKGAVHIGLIVGFTADATADLTAIPDVVILARDPFRRSAASFVISTHAATLQAAAISTEEELGDRLSRRLPNIVFDPVVEQINVELLPPDTVRVTAAVHIPDYCGPGPANFINLDFDIVLEAELSVTDGTVRVEGDPRIDFSNWDVASCALSAITDVSILNLVDVFVAIGGLLMGIGRNALDVGALAEQVFTFSGVVDPETPIPLTELVPRGEVMQVMVTSDRVELRGVVDLYPATDWLFGYVEVREAISPRFVGGAVEGAVVQAMDQDAPGTRRRRLREAAVGNASLSPLQVDNNQGRFADRAPHQQRDHCGGDHRRSRARTTSGA